MFRISVLLPGLFHNPSFYSHLTSGPNLPKKNVSFVGVFLRRNFNHNKEYTYTTLHWHHNAVSSLCFTPEGKHTLKSNSAHTFFIQTRISALFQVVSRFCVFFFCPGTNLLSGGVESVLVQWKYQENQRDFLPRLGAAITHITVSPDGALFCSSHSDNSKPLPARAIQPAGKPSHPQNYLPFPLHFTCPLLFFFFCL